MLFDSPNLLRATVRAVAHDVGEGGLPHRVTLRRRLEAEREVVWRTLTEPERVAGWFLPLRGDLKAGRRYQLEGMGAGEILACDAPNRFHLTWESNDQLSEVELMLSSEIAGQTELRLSHRLPDDDHWRHYGAGAVGVGWEMALVGLMWELAGRLDLSKPEIEAWFASDAGKAFVRGSAEGWGEAQARVDLDAQAARDAARRTAGFYTGD